MEATNAPTQTRQAYFGKTKSPTSYLLPFTSYLLPPTSYLLPLTSYLSPFTSYLLPPTSYLLPPRNLTTHVKKMGNDPREKDGKFSSPKLGNQTFSTHVKKSWDSKESVQNQYKNRCILGPLFRCFLDVLFR